MSEPYYNRYQRPDWIKLQAYKNVISGLHKKRNVFLDCGLQDAAKKAWGEISMAQKEHDALKEKMIQDREAMSASLIEVILIANLAYAKAMEFSELIQERTGTPEPALAEDVKRLVNISKEIALSVDEAGNDKQTRAFSDVIDETEEEYNSLVRPLTKRIMDKLKKSKRFRLF